MRRLIGVALVAVSLLFGATAPTYAGKPVPAPLEPVGFSITQVSGTAEPEWCVIQFAWSYDAPKRTRLVGYEFSSSLTLLSDWSTGAIGTLPAIDTSAGALVTNGGPGYYNIRAILEGKVKGQPVTSYSPWGDGIAAEAWNC
jgi:hypothetical protein